MIKASSKTSDGKTLLVLGITPENVRRMKAGHPILVDGSEVGIDNLLVTIMFGQTERSIVAEIRSHGIETHGADEQLSKVEAEHRRKGTTP